MDKTQSEVTDKIRYAIKKKLVEINLFVDDELPDYIMILIANKRSKHHMEKDLSLFLGNKTTDFTSWLWDLVNRLKAGSKTQNVKASSAAESKHSDNILELKESRADEDDVLNYDPAEEGETLCLEEINEPSQHTSPGSVQFGTNQHNVTRSLLVINDPESLSLTESKMPCTTVATDSSSIASPLKTPYTVPQTETVEKTEASNIAEVTRAIKSQPSSSIKTLQKSAKVYPIPRAKQTLYSPSNMPEKQIQTAELVNDSTKPEHSGSVSSVVCVTQRKYGGPAALQANKLLLKAVNDATKSVLNGKDINEYYKPTPIKEFSSNKLEDVDVSSDIVSRKVYAEENLESEHQVSKTFDVYETSEDSYKMKTETLQSRHVINATQVPSEVDFVFEDLNASRDVQQLSDQLEGDESSITPHFIVTLDGVSFSSLKRKHSIEEPMEIDEEEEETIENLTNAECMKKHKVNERCKYWPFCKNSDSCVYHHPAIPCKCFPDCKFGDKCLYIHPNCKFDSLCSRKDCPYTHCSKRKFQALSNPVTRPVKIPITKTVCKYYPKCTAKSCRFIHPKLCRFGTQCRAPTCPFSHFQVPQRNQLKWEANLS